MFPWAPNHSIQVAGVYSMFNGFSKGFYEGCIFYGLVHDIRDLTMRALDFGCLEALGSEFRQH